MRPTTRFLEDALVKTIIMEARDLLCSRGVGVAHPILLETLESHGAGVDFDREHVILTESMIDTALSGIKSSFHLYGVDGANSFRVGGNSVHFTPGSSAVTFLGAGEDKARKPLTDDYIRYAKVINGLSHFSFQSTAFVPADVPAAVCDAYRLFLSLMVGNKPIVTGAFTKESFYLMKDMLTLVRGSAKQLADKPLAIFTVCPTSPLKWGKISCQNLIDCVDSAIPVEIVAMPLSGFTAPATLNDTLIQLTAELLSGVVMAQLLKRGIPVMVGSATTIFDMRYETTPSGAIEGMMLSCANHEIGRYLQLPTEAYVSLSDAKAVDAQAGFETGIGACLAALSGINNIVGAGMLEFINCFSIEKLVFDHEIIAMVKRLTRGIEPNEDFPARNIFSELQAEQHLLISKHTRRYLKTEHLVPSPIVDRTSASRFIEEGSPALEKRIALEIERLEALYKPNALPITVKNELSQLMQKAAPELRLPNLIP